MPLSQTPRQTWAQARIDEVYANNAHPYFAREDHHKGRLNAAMLRLNQETAPPPQFPSREPLISTKDLLGNDTFATIEDAADFLSKAAGKGAAPTAPGALDLDGGRSRTSPSGSASPIGSKNRSSRIAAIGTGGIRIAATNSQNVGTENHVRNPADLPKGPADYTTSDQAHAAPPPRTSQNPPPTIFRPVSGQVRNDDLGRGKFGESRDSGKRKHEAIDLLTTPGEAVSSLIDGKVSQHGFIHGDGGREYYYVEVEGSGKYAGLNVRVLYIDQNSRLALGAVVKAGQSILGLSDDVRVRYGARMKPHIHIQVKWHGKFIDPALVLPKLQPGNP